MGYKYDAEKENLIRICQNQGTQTSSRQVIITNVDFNLTTRKTTISYTEKIGKRTIKKTFSYMGNKYKLLNDWTYTQKQKEKVIILTNNEIENLKNNSDEIVVLAKEKIIAKLPEELIPSWKKAQKQFGRLESIALDKKNNIEKKYSELNDLKARKEDLEQKVKVLERDGKLNRSNLITAQKRLEATNSWLLEHTSFFHKIIYYFTIRSKTKERDYFSEETERLNNVVKANERDFNKIKEELNEINSTYMPLVSEKRAKLSNVDKWLKESKEMIEKTTKPLENDSNIKYTDAPPKDWVEEERKKMGRVYSNGLTLRQFILERDKYTCKFCGNSTSKEPNLLLEVDHIIPVSKWGKSTPQNLQTLCWKCNRSKSDKID